MHIGAILFGLFMMLLSVAALIFWIWTLVDCLTSKRLSETQKIVWALVIFFVGIIGSLIYFFAGRSPSAKVYAPVQQAYYYPQQQYQQPPAEQVATDGYRSYQEGYQARNVSQPVVPGLTPSVDDEQPGQTQAQYEHIQISYPE